MKNFKKRKKEVVKRKQKETSTYTVTVNRNYKDTVFRKLFHQKKELLELYNALNDSNYTKEEELEIVTLDSCLYMSIRNDLAFILDFLIPPAPFEPPVRTFRATILVPESQIFR